jgi:hypothetical protein
LAKLEIQNDAGVPVDGVLKNVFQKQEVEGL